MVMVSDYTVSYDEEENIVVESSVISYCPMCGGVLSYRDTCERIMLLERRERRNYIIRRLKCHHCGKLHRELPDCLVPYKHYAAEVISGTLDGVVTLEDDDSEDYPCAATMKKWHHWLVVNYLRMEEYLKMILAVYNSAVMHAVFYKQFDQSPYNCGIAVKLRRNQLSVKSV